MNRYLIVSGIAVLLICVGLSGCEDLSSTDYGSDYVELSDIEVVTKWRTELWGSDSSSSWNEMSGFYYDYDKDAFEHNVYYNVFGVVKNIGDKPIDSVIINAKFYDNKGNHLSI